LKKSTWILFAPTALILLLDQSTKIWVRSTLRVGQVIPVIGTDFFRLTHVENTGIAFGISAGGSTLLSIFSILASIFIIGILLYSRNKPSEQFPLMMQIALALILGGALGNLVDRLLFGRVTDFLDFDFPDWIMSRWPVFNVADSAVTIGVTLWCIYLVFFSRSEAKAKPQTEQT
jgi:signal peptidase II